MPDLVDDLGTPYRPQAPPRRIVSLVPSLTEAVAVTDAAVLVGATDYCTHPAALDVARVGGSRFPNLDAVQHVAPDLVLGNAEENQLADLERLRAVGIPVWVTAPTTLAEAFGSLRRMLAACGLIRPAGGGHDGDAGDDGGQDGDPAWLDQARRAWSSTYDGSAPRRTAVVPIWRRPWRVLGSGTFGGDMLRRLGIGNAFGDAAERYPVVTVEQLRACGADLVVLPDEPYAFTAADATTDLAGMDVAVVSGRHLFWYGPSLVEARDVLERQLSGG